MPVDEAELKRQIEAQIKASFESSLSQSSKMQEEMLKQVTQNAASGFNAQAMRSFVYDGKNYSFIVSVENGKKCLLNNSNYKLVFTDLNKDINASYFDVYSVSLVDEGVAFSNYALSKIKATGEFMLYYVNQEGDFFTLYKFNSMPSDEEVCARAVANHEAFKANNIKGFAVSEYLELRRKTVMKVRGIFGEAKNFRHFQAMQDYKLLILNFEPTVTPQGYSLSIAYDFKDDKFFILNTVKSLEFFINSNKMQLSLDTGSVISKEHPDLLYWLIRAVSVNQFKEVIYKQEDFAAYANAFSNNKPVNLSHISEVVNSIKSEIKPPYVENDAMVLLFVNKTSGDVEKWTCSYDNDSTKNVVFKIEVIARDVFAPDFIAEDYTGSKIKYID